MQRSKQKAEHATREIEQVIDYRRDGDIDVSNVDTFAEMKMD